MASTMALVLEAVRSGSFSGPSTTTAVSAKPEECSSSKEREARSVALEKAYVHDVYQQIASHFTESRYRPWPKVKQFLLDLEPGSVICDVGCGNGKYLGFNPLVYKIGLDRCSSLTKVARQKEHEVLICDNLELPFRDECFDAVLSIAVIHHFATTERRVAALKELARVLRIGGRLMVSVWAMEQRHRKFESQDVLIPWTRPLTSSSDDKTSSIERDLNSTTTTTSDDDATHYHAYTQTSDSDSFPSISAGIGRRRGRVRNRGQSIDPMCPSSSQSSSDLSSPNESCYSFVRRALQKLAGAKRHRGGRRPWFLQGLDIPMQDEEPDDLQASNEEDGANNPAEHLMPIELRQLESTEFAEFLKFQEESRKGRGRGLLFSNVLYPRRRRTLETACDLQSASTSIGGQPKSKSLSDLFGLLPASILRSHRRSTDEEPLKEIRRAVEVPRSDSSLSEHPVPDDVLFPNGVTHKAVQTDSFDSLDLPQEPCGSRRQSPDESEKEARKLRPTLVKQKQSICSPAAPPVVETSWEGDEDLDIPGQLDPAQWSDLKNSVKDLPQFPEFNGGRGGRLHPGRAMGGSTFWKQSSLNEDLIFTGGVERLKEKERLRQNITKQCSFNEELIYKRRESNRWDQMKEAFLNSPNVKCFQLLKNGLSSRFRAGPTTVPDPSSPSATNPQKPCQRGPANQSTSSLRNGLVRILQNWKQGDESEGTEVNSSQGPSSNFLRRGSKEAAPRRGLFPPFFLRRSSAGSLNISKVGKDMMEPNPNILSPPPFLKRRPSENDLIHDVILGGGANGSKLLPGVRHVRKLSREEGSDSSKDSSFQSDTSVDSEDSFASVIFIPKPSGEVGGDVYCFGSETRANSTDSDRSPKSPASRLSPPNHNVPKSPSPLASEILKRRSPEVSPTRFGLLSTNNGTKFVFDESLTRENLLVVSNSQSESSCRFPNEEEPPQIPPVSPLKSQLPTKIEEEVELEEKENFIQTDAKTPPKEEPKSEVKRETEPLPPPLAALPKKKIEKIECLRKPAVLPENRSKITRQLVRRSLPKSLAVELFNPETDDADTSDAESSSSPNSISSVVSVVNEEVALLPSDDKTPQIRVQTSEELEEKRDLESGVREQLENLKLSSSPERVETSPLVSSLESLQSSPKGRRKLTLARLGSTSEWLSSLPSDLTSGSSSSSSSSYKKSSGERRNPGEKILLGEVKKFQQKGQDTKWPTSMIDESPPPNSLDLDGSFSNLGHEGQAAGELAAKLVEELEEKESLFDSMENLTTSRHEPSRNPSIDSSVRMSSTCSCSIRGGDSFESWTSAKSSLTNSSSTHQKPCLLPAIPLHGPSTSTRPPALSHLATGMRHHRGPRSSKSSSANGEETEDSTALTYHRYYHVFREGELDKLIEKYVQNLHIISSYYDHANWCVVAEKVQVWTI